MKSNILTKKLVIGSCLRALQYASAHNAMIIVNAYSPPHELEEPAGWHAWHRLSFTLGIRGLRPIPSEVESIRVGDGFVGVTTEFFKSIKIRFQELYIFDLEKITGLAAEERVGEYTVYDWFNIKRGAKQKIKKIDHNNSFVHKLCFYPSKRIDGNRSELKDCYAKSYIKAEDLGKFEFSETAAKFAVTKLIKENNIKGPPRRFGSSVHRLNLILEHDRRDLYKKQKEFIVNESLPPNIFLL